MAKSSPINYPPGPSSRLPLNLFFDFLRDPITVLHNLSKEYGDISHFKFGKQHIYLINDPDYIKDVLVTYDNNFTKSRGLQLAKRVLGEGLLTSEGELHRRQRQLIQPIFHPDEIPNYANIITNYALDISSKWNDDDHCKIDIHREFMHLTLAIVCKAFFNVSIEESETKEIDQYVTTLIEYFNRARIPFAEIIEKLPLPNNMRFRYAKKELDKIISRYEKPLSLYLFSEDKSFQKEILNTYSFGGGCINDTLVHFSNKRLPFGGVGHSGIGAYHGKLGFDTFSHKKSIVKKANWLDVPLRYAPYKGKLNNLQRILKWLG